MTATEQAIAPVTTELIDQADRALWGGQTGLRFIAHGIPKPKGSMKHIGHGRLKEQVEGSKPWREAVKWAALAEIAAQEGTGAPFAMLSGPLEVEVVFTFRKPKSAPKTRRIWPITRSSGDVDKLERNVLDALVDAGVMADDSQVVRLVGEKAFVDEHPSALPTPGARVIVRPLPSAAMQEIR